jgi:hypothetical protein
MKSRIYTLYLPIILLLIQSFSYAGNTKDMTATRFDAPNQHALSFSEDNENIWTISGFITKNNNTVPFAGVTVVFSGYGIVTTDEDGFYALDVPNNWTGTVTPIFCDPHFLFSPSSRNYSLVRKHFSQQNYQAAVSQYFSISGTLTHSQTGEALNNQLITFENGMTTTTDENGVYEILVEPCFSDTLRPVSDDYNFTPEYRVYQGVVSDFPNQHYSVIDKSFGLPPGWEFNNTGTVHIISVFTSANPNVCGIPLQEGDYIGVFYVGDDGELHCGGAGEWTGLSNTPIMANGNDGYTSIKDGFYSGETIHWRIYRWTADQQEYVAYPTFQSGGYLYPFNKWLSGGLSIVNNINGYHTQYITIPAGWSGISGYLQPPPKPHWSPGNQMTFLTAPILDNLVVMQTLTGLYYPSQGINTIPTWNVNQGYKIKVSEDIVLPLPGCPLGNRTQNLSASWNLIPVKSECHVLVSELFDPVINRVTVVKEVAGNNLFWPQMGINTLQVLSPGKSYLVAMNQTASISFPECDNLKSHITAENTITENKTNWPDPVNTPTNHIIAIYPDALKMFDVGDYLGAFTTEGAIAGLTEITAVDQNMAITVYGDDATDDEKVGFDEGEPLRFRLFKTSTGETMELSAEFDSSMPSHDGTFAGNGISLIKALSLSSTGFNTAEPFNNNIIFYPNPSFGAIDIKTSDAPHSVSIWDMLGSSVYKEHFSGNHRLDLSHLHQGVYIIRIEGEGSVMMDKLMLK